MISTERTRSERRSPASPPARLGPERPVWLPTPMRHCTTQLLAQQFWLFGFDIRRTEGNLLLHLGFDKHRPPEESRVTASRYTFTFPDDRAVMLWGFGMYWRDPTIGGMFLPRNAVTTLVRASTEMPDDAWDPMHIDSLVAPRTALEIDRCRVLLVDALTWVREYETSVRAIAGAPYRELAVQAWKRPCGPAAELPDRWQRVIDAVATNSAAGPIEPRLDAFLARI